MKTTNEEIELDYIIQQLKYQVENLEIISEDWGLGEMREVELVSVSINKINQAIRRLKQIENNQ